MYKNIVLGMANYTTNLADAISQPQNIELFLELNQLFHRFRDSWVKYKDNKISLNSLHRPKKLCKKWGVIVRKINGEQKLYQKYFKLLKTI